MLDPISDMITRIRNAQMAGHREVLVPASKFKKAIAEILVKRGFIVSTTLITRNKHPYIKIDLKYDQVSRTQKKPAISEISRVSREGQRRYVKKDEIARVKNGAGVAVISTSQGVMSGEDAFKRGLGGEYICKVW